MNAVQRAAWAARQRFHERRADLFMALMRPRRGMRILDLGSGWGDPFMARIARRVPVRVTLADVTEGPREDAERLGFDAVILREGEPLPFADGEFDIVLSNSVIEHVTMRRADDDALRPAERAWRWRSLRAQRRFAAEIQRVGRGYFVQTPHRHFPLDLHMWLPFTNWLPHTTLKSLVPVVDRFWFKQTGYPDWHLLGPRELRRLLPGCRIRVERFAGLPKSVVAYLPDDAAGAAAARPAP
jgi:hypothetical protein